MNRLPFHAVLRSNLAEVCLDDLGIGVGGEKSLVGCNTAKFLPLGLDQLMKADFSLSSLNIKAEGSLAESQREESE